ncbi:MAG TPA: hypothetical protein VFI42_17770 [Thermomicrobiaceae bacterium]|nr:hypothetical protein [Thermomicrobiaceae bacterium]
MIEPRRYTTEELLAWCRFAALTLLGSALAYTREREGTLDSLIDFISQRLSDVYGGTLGVEPAMLGLLLNVQALGGELRSTMMNPAEGEAVVSNLPGEQVAAAVAELFDVAVTAEDMLALCGISQADLNRLYDIFGQAAAGAGLVYAREPLDGDQRLTLGA